VHVENGVLRCDHCSRLFLIEDGLVELLGDGLRDESACLRFKERFAKALSHEGLLDLLLNRKAEEVAGLEDQLKQRRHFDWFAQNDTQSYNEYQRTPFWMACDAQVLARWRAR
jgi:hypothetical protein